MKYCKPVHEGTEQMNLFRWAAYNTGKYPELELLHHIPNGGLRNKAVAAKLKMEGVKAGVPDLCLPVPRGPYHGMYIEMKVGNNKTTKDQDKWISELNGQGYYTIVSYGWQDAYVEIENYLRLEKRGLIMLQEAIKKIDDEMNKNKNNRTYKRIGEYLKEIIKTNQQAEKILVKEKSIKGSIEAMSAEAKKVAVSNCGVLTDEEGFEIVRKYFDIKEEPGSGINISLAELFD